MTDSLFLQLSCSLPKRTKNNSICFVAPTVYPYFIGGGLGGAELQIIQLSRLFAKVGYHVVIITNDYGQQEKEVRDGIEIFKVPLRFLGGNKLYFLGDVLRFISFLNKLSPDYCFVKTPNVVLFFVALTAKFNHRIKPVKLFALDYDCIVKGFNIPMILYRYAIKWTNLFIFQTKKQQEETKLRLRKNGPVIRNVFIPPERSLKKTQTKDLDVLWVGAYHPNKCPEMFYEIARSLSKYQFGMISKNLPENYKKLHKMISELPNVRFFGQIPFQDTQNYFERSRLFLCTSVVEGFPNCFLQAWWSRLPVVSLTFPCDGLLQEKGIGLVSGSLQKICKDIDILLQNESLRVSIGLKGRQYLEMNHLPESILVQYQKFMTQHNSIC